MDIVDKRKRSRMMAGIRGKNTRPEIKIRKALFALGFRYRINKDTLPGKPDIVLKKYNAVVFVNGCFWHLHDCHLFKWPTTRADFWKNKIEANKDRDSKNQNILLNLGLRVLVVWECSLKGKNRLEFEYLVSEIEIWLRSDVKYKELRGS